MKKLMPILILLLLGLAGCNTKTNVVTSENRSTSGSGGTDGGWTDGGSSGGSGGDDDDDDTWGGGDPIVGDKCIANGQPRNDSSPAYPYKRYPIISHGKMSILSNKPTCADPSVSCAWTSENNQYIDQNAFVTDSILKIRMMAKTSPGQGNDSYNNECRYLEIPYKKLSFTVGVRAKGQSYYNQKVQFQNIEINGCSQVIQFPVPYNSSGSPFIVEVFDVKWDYRTTACSGECGMIDVWDHDCVAYELQMETDYTAAIPE